MEKEQRRPLCPKILDETDKLFPCVEELRYVVGSTRCRNIALTGVFGSGKSSVLETFLSSEPRVFKKALKISLSTFTDNQDKEPIDEKKYEADIEYKIVQHILYKSDPAKTTQSRFERVAYLSTRSMRLATVFASIAALCILMLVKPGFLHLEMMGETTGIIIDLVSITYLCFYSVRLLFKGIQYVNRIRINNISAKGIEVALSRNSSVFNKLLDEIVYFFNANEYDIVVFEDLDRLREPRSLFLKLRELNMLLNESEEFIKLKKTIRFVYAIKDDIFTDDIRTKCFDYIIPVVPVIDRFNASDYLIEHKSDLFDNLDEADIRELGVWISGFRELNNVLNEFNLYKKLVMVAGMSEKKLLAIIIYKNLYPNDFANLHKKDGFLYSVFAKRKVFTDPLTHDNTDRVESLRSEIASSQEKIRKIKKSYLDYVAYEKHVESFYVGEEPYSIEDVLRSDYLFNLFQSNAFTKYYYVDSANEDAELIDYNIDFRDIEREIDSDISYAEAVYEPLEIIRADEKAVDDLNRKIRNTEQDSLQNIFHTLDGAKVRGLLVEIERTVDKKEIALKVDFVQTMIRGGYIVEDYPSYISFYHPGSLKESDFKFLNSVRQGIKLNYDYKVEDPEEVVGQLRTDNYIKDSILNFDLLDYLLSNKDKANLLDLFVRSARLEPAFVVAYNKASRNPQTFIAKLFSGWDHAVDAIRGLSDETLQSEMLLLFFDASPMDIKLSNQERSFIGDCYPFINHNIADINAARLKEFICQYKIKFGSLIESRGTRQAELLDFVANQGHFVINYDNLRVYLGEDFDTGSFSAISTYGSKGFYDYVIEKNLDETLKEMPSTSVEEKPDALKKLINLKGVEEDWLADYLAKQKMTFESLDGISDKKQHIVFETDKVIVSWNNILTYFTVRKVLDDTIIAFISRHVDVLAKAKCEGAPDIVTKLQRTLFCGNALTSGAYNSLLTCFEGEIDYSDLAEDLDEERVVQLITRKILGYSSDALEYINANYSEDATLLFFIKYYEELLADDTVDWNIYLNNHIGIVILESELTLSQKKRFIDDYALIDTDSDDSSKYAALICIYYVKVGKIDSDTDKDVLLDSLKLYQRDDSWWNKITLINMMNDYYDYDHDTEVIMINSLGGGYRALNSFYGRAHFDVNSENIKLLQYLKDHRHYVSNYYKGQDKKGKEQFFVSFLHG